MKQPTIKDFARTRILSPELHCDTTCSGWDKEKRPALVETHIRIQLGERDKTRGWQHQISYPETGVADLMGHSTSQITELYYVKKDTSRLRGITNDFILKPVDGNPHKNRAENFAGQKRVKTA